MPNIVLNNLLGSPYDLYQTQLTAEQENSLMVGFLEQLLLFDKISITTSRLNFALYFLIKKFGINQVEVLIERGYVEFFLWSPNIFTSTGRMVGDEVDRSTIYGQAPLVAGSLHGDDLDPEANIDTALSRFNIPRDRKRIFKRITAKKYTVPDGLSFATKSVDFVLSAYRANSFVSLGLPYEKEPEMLNLDERNLLSRLSNNALETAVLINYGFKGYENYEYAKIMEQSLSNIGSALKVTENAANVFKLEKVPDLKSLILSERLDLESVLRIRHLSNAKYFRSWINSVSENYDAEELSRELLNQATGKSSFFQGNFGKLVRSITVTGVGVALGHAIPLLGTLQGAIALGLFDTFLLEGMLKPGNPRLFVDETQREIKRMKYESGEI